MLEAKSGAKSGTIKAVFDAHEQGGTLLMTETRTITFYSDPELRIIDYEIEIRAFEPLHSGTRRKAPLVFAWLPLSRERTGKMVNAEGQETEKNVWGKRSPWVDYFGQMDGKTVGVAIMDHPSNPRHPTYWHSRDYGLFAANPFGMRDFTGDKTKDGNMKSRRDRAALPLSRGDSPRRYPTALTSRRSTKSTQHRSNRPGLTPRGNVAP